MHRRDFLKRLLGLSLTWMAAPVLPLFPVPVRVNSAPAPLYSQTLNRTFKGTPDGLVLESRDDSATWQTIANFGNHCSVQALYERQGKIYAQVGVQANSFLVASADARKWYTVS